MQECTNALETNEHNLKKLDKQGHNFCHLFDVECMHQCIHTDVYLSSEKKEEEKQAIYPVRL